MLLLNQDISIPIESHLPSFFSSSFLFLFVIFVFLVSPNFAHGYDPSFAWDANTESDIAGYNIYYKTDSSNVAYNSTGANEGSSPIQIPVTSLSDPENPQFTIHGLNDTESYFFVITAYDTAGNESNFSNELSYTPTSSTPENTAPKVTIMAPADRSSFNQYDSITFRGSAIDAEDGNISGNLSWVSNLDGAIGTGATFSTSTLSEGTHTITVSAKDSGNLSGSAKMALTVLSPSENNPPKVTITAPANGSLFSIDDSITFRGSAIDPEDGDISNRLSWVSNIDGVIGSGASLSTASLSEGMHTITVSATDNDNLSSAATMTLTVLFSTTSMVVDNDDPGTSYTGSWPVSRGTNYYGTPSRYSTSVNGKYSYDVPLTGSYDIYLWWTTRPNRCSAVPVEIYDDTTLLDTVTVNHQTDGGQWNPIGLGGYTFTGQAKVSIVSTATGRCSTSADAVKFVSSSTPENTAPKVTITAPAGGSSFNRYDSITFRGSAVDTEDGNISNRLSWVSSIDGVIGSGATLTTSALSAGTHTITVSAKDSGNLSGTATITLTVLSPSQNAAPKVTITAPAGGSSFNLNDSITFRGSAVDAEDGNISNRLSWVSSIDGVIGSGATLTTSALSAGTHTITVSAKDSGNLSGAATVTLTVLSPSQNTAPKVTITSPAGGSSFNQYDSITFRGSAIDAEDGNISNRLSWVSNIDGIIGAGATFSTSALSAGTHTITVSAKDSSNLSGTATMTLTVLSSSQNTAPKVTITSPAGGSSFNQYDSITFRGSAIDAEDGNISNRLSWVSNHDGAIGSGATFSTSALSAGTHTITVSAKDNDNLSGTATLTLTVLSSNTSIVIDNGDPGTSFTGTWGVSGGTDPWNPVTPSANSLWSRDGDTYTWTFTPSVSGIYELSMWWTGYPSRSSNVPVTIEFSGGKDIVSINQQVNGGRWNTINSYPFVAGKSYDITVTGAPGGTQDYSTCADAVQFVYKSGLQDTMNEVIIDNGDRRTSFTGTWDVSGGVDPWNPADPSATSLWSRDGDTYTWTFTPSISGTYELSMWWTEYPSRSAHVPVSIEFSGGTDTVTINQQTNGGKWNTINSYLFVAGKSYDITITAVPGGAQNFSTCADAVRFVSSPTSGNTAP